MKHLKKRKKELEFDMYLGNYKRILTRHFTSSVLLNIAILSQTHHEIDGRPNKQNRAKLLTRNNKTYEMSAKVCFTIFIKYKAKRIIKIE